MSLRDTLITDGNPASVIYKDALRPGSTQPLGNNFSSGIYHAVNITDPITPPGLQMFYVEVFNTTSSGAGASGSLPIPGGLAFTNAYIVLRDISPSSKLNIAIPWTGNSNTTFRVLTSANVSNVNASFLIIGV
jgi:hypothetical protein